MRRGTRTKQAELKVDGLPIPVSVRRSSQARRLTLRIDQRGHAVVLTIPVYCAQDEAAEFVTKHLGWVKDRLGALPRPVPFEDGSIIPLRDVGHTIKFERPSRGSPVVESDRTEGELRLIVRGRSEHAPRRLRDWLIAEARKDLVSRVRFHGDRLGLKASRISIKDQSTRWGSCSSTGTLSFSWRLILAPEHVLDYVAAHEVAHLAEMNHGPNFWALVKQTCPDMERSRTWLKMQGAQLHCFGQKSNSGSTG